MYVKKLVEVSAHESQDKPRKVAQARLEVGRNFEVMHHSKERQRGMCTPQRIDAGMRSLSSASSLVEGKMSRGKPSGLQDPSYA